MNYEKLFKGVLTINCYGCSGSGLMLSLLDGHPNCIGFQDTLLAGYQDWWDNLKVKNGTEVMEDFLNLYQVMFDPSFKHPSRAIHANIFGEFSNLIGNEVLGITEISVPKIKFIECLSSLVSTDVEETASVFFKKIHIALAFSLDKSITAETIIVYGATNMHPARAKFLMSGFKHNWNLLMVRDPVISHYAQIKQWEENPIVSNFHNPDFHITHTLDYMQSFYLSIEGWEYCTKAVRLEDVHNNHKQTMTKIINWLDIPWNDSLYRSTFLGTDWKFSNKKIHSSPINPEIISRNRYSHLFTSSDYHLLSMTVSNLYEKWSYDLSKHSMLINYLLAIYFLFRRLKIEKMKKVRLKYIIISRVKMIVMLIGIKYSKKRLSEHLIGDRLTRIMLKIMGRNFDQVKLSKTIIKLL